LMSFSLLLLSMISCKVASEAFHLYQSGVIMRMFRKTRSLEEAQNQSQLILDQITVGAVILQTDKEAQSGIRDILFFNKAMTKIASKWDCSQELFNCTELEKTDLIKLFG
jgi:hypothetical protein